MEYQIIKFHLVANLTTIAGKSCEGEINSKIVKSFYDQCCEYIGKCEFFFDKDNIYKLQQGHNWRYGGSVSEENIVWGRV